MVSLESLKLLWEHRASAALVALIIAVLCLKVELTRNTDLRHQLDARPTVEDHAEAKTAIRIVKGPVRIVTRTTTEPSGERIVERTLERQSEVQTKDSDIVELHSEKPTVAAAAEPKKWFVGASASLLKPGREFSAKAGYVILPGLEVAVGYPFSGQDRLSASKIRADLSYTFRF